MPEEHHLYSALQAKPSPGIQTFRDALFPARQTPREAPGSSVSQSRSWSCAKQTLRASSYSQRCHLQQLVARPGEGQQYEPRNCDFSGISHGAGCSNEEHTLLAGLDT